MEVIKIDIMPFENDYEEFKKYLLSLRKEYKLKVRWDIKKNGLILNNTLIYFRNYIECMCYLEGFKKGVMERDNRRRQNGSNNNS